METTVNSIRPVDPFVAFPQLVTLGVGILSVFIAVTGGFGWLSLSRTLELFPYVDGRVFTSVMFPLERWLLVAVFVTSFYSLIFYFVFQIQLTKLNKTVSANNEKAITAALVLFPVVNVALLAATFYALSYYCSDVGRAESLKYATGILLVSFVVNDVLSMYFGSKTESVKHLKVSGWNALVRLDLPVLAAFALLMVFAKTAVDGSHASAELISAFSLGAAAFKLLVTVSIFTIISYEEYAGAVARSTNRCIR